VLSDLACPKSSIPPTLSPTLPNVLRRRMFCDNRLQSVNVPGAKDVPRAAKYCRDAASVGAVADPPFRAWLFIAPAV
jgi:hypothetical protein